MSEVQSLPEPRDLHPASQGEDVSNLQTALFNAGYEPGPVDGYYGARTAAAVKDMQARNGQPPDGIVGPQTWRALSSLEGAEFLSGQPLRRLLRPASEGDDVALAQEALVAAGLNPGETDGVYRPGTEAAVKRFQNNEGLKVTGILDEATRQRLLPVRVGEHLLSANAGEVMTLAVRLTGNNPENVPGPASILVAALKNAVDDHRDPVTVAFCDRLPGLESSRPLPERHQVLERLAQQANLVSDFDRLDPGPVEFDRHLRFPLPVLLSIADDLAQNHGSTWIEVVHLLVAAVNGQWVLLPPDLPAVFGLDGAGLRERLGDAIDAAQTLAADLGRVRWWLPSLGVTPPEEPLPTGAPVPGEQPEPDESDDQASEPFRLSGGISGDAVPSLNAAAKFEDALNVQTYVSMLALAIADRNTPMPLSIGLFGEWGTGKSYFMGLLKQEVERLSDRASERDSPFYSDIVHISFNAWHYSDANLWASLADEIFEQLAGRNSSADSNDSRRKKLRDELGRSLNKRKELEASTEQAKARAEELRGQLEAERARHQASARSLATTLLGDPEVRAQLDIAADKLGLDQAEEAQRLADELAGTTGESRLTWQALATSKWSPAWVVTSAVVLLASLGALLLADGVEFKWAGLAGIGAAIAAFTNFLSGVRQGLVALRKGVAKAHALKEAATNKDLNARIKELQTAESNVQVASAQLEEVVAKVGQLGRELAELNPGSRLYSFLAEKAASADYQQRLGIVSMIRKDFEQLVALMTSWAEENARSRSQFDERPPPLDRIVLYIDDLDRCEPSQVVDVLQAVHLLLAMNLFVVVVGVDPRWLQRSLRLRYEGIMGAGEQAEDDGFRGSTPNDYLEKIFNIPIVLPAMDKSGFSRLLRTMAFGTVEPAGPAADGQNLDRQPEDPGAGSDRTVERPAPEAGATGAPGLTSEPEDSSPGAAGDAGSPEVATSLGNAADAGQPAAAPVVTQAAQAAAEIAAAPSLEGQAGSAVEAVTAGKAPVVQPLTDRELEFLDLLAPLVRTPRSAKRMFNLYRMLRSAREVDEASEFLGTDKRPGEYQAVAQLLAVLTSEPRVLGHMITARPHDVRKGGLLHRRPQDSWNEFVAELAPTFYTASDGSQQAENGLLARIPKGEIQAWVEISEALTLLLPAVGQTTIRPYREWAPQVARFSFLLSPFAAEVEVPDAEPDRPGTPPAESPAPDELALPG